MQLLHSIRKAINRILSPLGLAIERVQKKLWFLPATVTTKVGLFLIQVPTSNPIATHYSRFPDYTGQLGRLAALLKSKYANLSAIDIGANVGDTACIIKSSADIPVLCIEGDDCSFGFLEQNLRQFQNATAHKLFLGDKSETMSVILDKNGWNTTLIPGQNASACDVSLTSLDDFFAAHPTIQEFKLLKIDAEGFDCSILRGARLFLSQVHPVITFEYNRDNMAVLNEDGLSTIEMLVELGYSQVCFHDCDGRFFCSTSMTNRELIQDIHCYSDGKNGAIYYFDLTVFHSQDADLAKSFAKTERQWRTNRIVNTADTATHHSQDNI